MMDGVIDDGGSLDTSSSYEMLVISGLSVFGFMCGNLSSTKKKLMDLTRNFRV